MADDTTFPHTRGSDQEQVGYLRLSENDQFVPIDLMWNELGGPQELTDAEALLEELGLSYLAEDWLLDVEGHPEPVKVRIREITPGQITVANADYGYPADIGTLFRAVEPDHRAAPGLSAAAPRRRDTDWEPVTDGSTGITCSAATYPAPCAVGNGRLHSA